MLIIEIVYKRQFILDIVQESLNSARKSKEYWSEIYQKHLEDLYFLSDAKDAQWDSSDYQSRAETGRPALTIDQLGQFVHQVVNDIKMNTPTIKCIPNSGGSDIETAEIIQGLIKDIEYRSRADDAYDTAVNFSVKSSIGFIRVDHDFVDDISFEQELRIDRVVNPTSIILDRNSIETDGSDAKEAWALEEISISEFRSLYPDFEPVSFSTDELSKSGQNDDKVTIAEYFKIEEEEKRVGLLEDGSIEEYQEDKEYRSVRTVKKRKVKRYKLSGQDVLEETTFPGKYIPIVPVYGEECWSDGKRELQSLIRKSKDAQRMFNYWKSLETELLMKQPNAPVMAAEGQVEDYADDWLNPTRSMVLRYKSKDNEGNMMPPPQRLAPPTIPTGVVNAARSTVDDIKSTMGLYNASLGQRSNEQSGIAIARRQQEGDVATYHFGDNLVKSITQVGKILVSAIPEIYDTPRIIRIIGLEEESENVGINGQISDDYKDRSFDLTKGGYSVRVITGAPFTTQRQAAAEFFTQIVTQQPQLMSIAGDLLFKYMDFPGAQALSARVKKTISPELLEDGEVQQDPRAIALAQQLEQSQVVIQQLQGELLKVQNDISIKQADLEVKRHTESSKIEQEKAKNELELLKIQQEDKKIAIDAEIKKAELAIKEQELLIKQIEASKEVVMPQNESVVVTDI